MNETNVRPVEASPSPRPNAIPMEQFRALERRRALERQHESFRAPSDADRPPRPLRPV